MSICVKINANAFTVLLGRLGTEQRQVVCVSHPSRRPNGLDLLIPFDSFGSRGKLECWTL